MMLTEEKQQFSVTKLDIVHDKNIHVLDEDFLEKTNKKKLTRCIQPD